MIKVYEIMKGKEMVNREGLFIFFKVILYDYTRTKSYALT